MRRFDRSTAFHAAAWAVALGAALALGVLPRAGHAPPWTAGTLHGLALGVLARAGFVATRFGWRTTRIETRERPPGPLPRLDAPPDGAPEARAWAAP